MSDEQNGWKPQHGETPAQTGGQEQRPLRGNEMREAPKPDVNPMTQPKLPPASGWTPKRDPEN